MTTGRKTRQHDRRGFALLLTLVLVLIAGVMLAALARQSTGEALATVDATERLQRKWAVASCRRTLLPRVGRVMDERLAAYAEDATGEGAVLSSRAAPSAHHWVRCELAGIDYDLVLTDEQAKYHPTRSQAHLKPGQAKRALTDLLGSMNPRRGARFEVRLRPMKKASREDGRQPNASAGPASSARAANEDSVSASGSDNIAVYEHYGQVIDNASPEVLLGSQAHPGPAARVTFWGDGRLRLDRADRRVISAALGPMIGGDGIRELSRAMDEAEGVRLTELPAGIEPIDGVPPQALPRMVTGRSQAHGLWVIARGKTRSWYTLSVSARRAEMDTTPSTPAATADDPNERNPAIRRAQPTDEPPANDATATDDAATSNDDERRNTIGPASPYTRYDFAW